uniref:Disintegrin domain-containing protein n=1 Tax=Chromera velia CCMP2878 TaxID=1169474 RepID=A0A0G4H8J7_9ALVE|eukprot:Cvel_5894.t1-p1 / transcript=Cvel_5894.t1 / gene=Cvel_5894 / organism=Chromera_velia_CCMP2878 / gene_product=Prestalk protein, putative / transcript_product=Prestalk protein, putative / location=Cvel_scaffold281:39054-41837(+) / protein_length=448 / sequence_SO=supercontig / SO=protein_coding / is_pseudo=false
MHACTVTSSFSCPTSPTVLSASILAGLFHKVRAQGCDSVLCPVEEPFCLEDPNGVAVCCPGTTQGALTLCPTPTGSVCCDAGMGRSCVTSASEGISLCCNPGSTVVCEGSCCSPGTSCSDCGDGTSKCCFVAGGESCSFGLCCPPGGARCGDSCCGDPSSTTPICVNEECCPKARACTDPPNCCESGLECAGAAGSEECCPSALRCTANAAPPQFLSPGSFFCCDDDNVCTDDVCVDNAAPGARCESTNNAASCEDGNVCTGPDMCSGGACLSGPPLTGTGCDDSDPCTENDQCNDSGGCMGTPANAPPPSGRDLSSQDCAANNGERNSAVSCDTPSLVPICGTDETGDSSGACCSGSECSVVPEAECEAADGKYQGNSTKCSKFSCLFTDLFNEGEDPEAKLKSLFRFGRGTGKERNSQDQPEGGKLLDFDGDILEKLKEALKFTGG